MSVYYNNAEAKNEKKPKNYQDFTYDIETDGGCVNKFLDASNIIAQVSSDVEVIGNRYTDLVKKYDKFTDYNTLMSSNKNSLRNSIDNIRKQYDKLLDVLRTQVSELQKNDSSLISELDNINKIMANEKELGMNINKTRKFNDTNNQKRPVSDVSDSSNESGFVSSKINGALSPGTTENTFEAKKYTIDKNSEEYKQLVATVYAEASEDPNYIESDTMAVMSAILNRCDTEGFPDNIYDVISAGDGTRQQQFEGFSSSNEKHSNAYNDMSIVPDVMIEIIDRVLDGERNTKGVYFWGDGTKNSFS